MQIWNSNIGIYILQTVHYIYPSYFLYTCTILCNSLWHSNISLIVNYIHAVTFYMYIQSHNKCRFDITLELCANYQLCLTRLHLIYIYYLLYSVKNASIKKVCPFNTGNICWIYKLLHESHCLCIDIQAVSLHSVQNHTTALGALHVGMHFIWYLYYTMSFTMTS